jgi:hypothetical protein
LVPVVTHTIGATGSTIFAKTRLTFAISTIRDTGTFVTGFAVLAFAIVGTGGAIFCEVFVTGAIPTIGGLDTDSDTIGVDLAEATLRTLLVVVTETEAVLPECIDAGSAKVAKTLGCAIFHTDAFALRRRRQDTTQSFFTGVFAVAILTKFALAGVGKTGFGAVLCRPTTVVGGAFVRGVVLRSTDADSTTEMGVVTDLPALAIRFALTQTELLCNSLKRRLGTLATVGTICLRVAGLNTGVFAIFQQVTPTFSATIPIGEAGTSRRSRRKTSAGSTGKQTNIASLNTKAVEFGGAGSAIDVTGIQLNTTAGATTVEVLTLESVLTITVNAALAGGSAFGERLAEAGVTLSAATALNVTFAGFGFQLRIDGTDPFDLVTAESVEDGAGATSRVIHQGRGISGVTKTKGMSDLVGGYVCEVDLAFPDRRQTPSTLWIGVECNVGVA